MTRIMSLAAHTLLLAAVTLAATGCSTVPGATADAAPPDATVSLAVLGPAPFALAETPAPVLTAGSFVFGAGDALGEEVFLYYVASLRLETLEQRYATAE